MSSPKQILVTGATGKQGRGVINALLLVAQTHDFHILALTRAKTSKAAISLASNPNVTLVEGDLDNPDAIFKTAISPIWGVFSVQIASPGSTTEEKQGKALVKAAIAAGVQYFVYTSGDRGGAEKSAVDPTSVKNFQQKFNIEKHLLHVASTSPHGMGYTILRPVTFFENQTPDRNGAGFARMWAQIGSKKLQMISTKDIGWFAAEAFSKPEAYNGKAISIAGDELTQAEAARIYKEEVGKEMKVAPALVGYVVKWAMQETLGDMFMWFKYGGYGADVAECKRIHPGILDYRTWLREESGHVRK
ncbi:hypothetical protein MMC13_006107 [Lambiella insularis]|nr:hypothetical protein [Lambiella insularis]